MTIQQHASFDSSAAELNATSKLVKAWESKNAKNAAKVGGISMMALSLAACGGSSTTTTTASTSTTTTTTTTAVTPVTSALTIGNDTVAGTTGNDSVTGARIDTVQSLNSGDSITLGTGTDSLSATLNAGTVTPAALTGVENVTFTALGTATVDFDNATGVTSITSLGSSAALTVDDIQALTTSLSVQNNTLTQTFVFKDAAVVGTSDSMTLNLDGAGAIVAIGGETDADGGIETFNVVASGGASDLGVGNGFGQTATSVNVTASSTLDLGSGASFAASTSFDASASTAAVTAVLADKAAAGETAVSIKGGAGADNFDIGAFTLANHGDITIDMGAGNDTLDMGAAQDTDTGSSIAGGAGDDTLIISGTALVAAENTQISGFEILNQESDAITQDADAFAGTIFGTGNAAVNAYTLSNLADDSTLNVNHTMTGNLTGTIKTDTASDAVTVNIGGTAGGITLAGLVLSTTYETVTVNSQGTAANVLTAVATNIINNMTFTGSTALTVSSTNNITGVVDFSASTANNTVTVTDTTAQTITFGSGNDTLTASGLLATGVTQTINGGAGTDTLTAGIIVTTGNLVLNGGAGVDTINTVAMVGAGGAVSTAVVDGGAGIDFITLDPNTNAGQVLQDVVSTVAATADMDVVVGFTTAVDDVDYNGTLLNGANTTVVKADDTTLAAAIVEDADATVFYVTTNLTGGAATALTNLANATTASSNAALQTAFEDAFVTSIGGTAIAGLDTAVGAGETVLLAYDNGTDSVLMKFTNSDTGTANTITAAELELVAVFDATATLAAGDVI